MSPPRKHPPSGQNTFERKPSQYNLARILAALKTGPKLYDELMTSLHMTSRGLNRYLGRLRGNDGAPRLVRVKGYKLIDSRWHRVYALGRAPDAPIPRQSNAEKNRQHRARVKADPDRSAKKTAYEAARWAVRKATSRPHGIFAALGL